jgi:hypothetical protein
MAFFRVLASHRGGPGSIPGWDMSASGSLDKDGDDLGQIPSWDSIIKGKMSDL